MFLTDLSQHARQFLHSLFCFAAGHVAPAVTTVLVLSQPPAAGWSIIGMLNRITRLSGHSGRKCFTHASRVGIQCLVSGVSLQTEKILSRCASSWTSPESCHLNSLDFLELIRRAIAAVQSSCLTLANLLYCASCTTLKT